MNRSLIALVASFLLVAPAIAGDEPFQPGEDHSGRPESPAEDSATPMTDGEIRSIDAAAGKITVKHGPISNLRMAPMTMVFRVADPAFLSQVRPGDMVRMTVERIDGALTITALQRVP